MAFLLNRNQFINLYDQRVVAVAKNVEKLHQKFMRVTQQIEFLRQCKRENVIPRGLQIYNFTKVNKNTRLIHAMMTAVRNNTLDWQYK